MDESLDDAAAPRGDEQPHAAAGIVYRGPHNQREVDAIFARLRAWRDRGRSA